MLVQTPERSSRRYAWVPADPRIKAPPLTFDRADAAEFDVAYDALARYFQPRGEVDPREVLRRLHAEPWEQGPLQCSYEAVLVRDATGALVGASDLYILLDRVRGIATCLISSVHVEPGPRSRAIGLWMDEALGAFLDVVAAERGFPPGGLRLVAGDVKAIDVDDLDSWTRLLLWSFRGLRMIPYEVFPLMHLADIDAAGRRMPPTPALVVIRRAGEPRRLDRLGREALHSLADGFAAIVGALIGDEASAKYVAWLRRTIAAAPHEVTLMPLPGETQTIEAIAPLLRSVAFEGAEPTERELQWLAARIAERGWS
jgi:hypothetical protein